MPAVNGLYATIGGLIGYAIFGPSRILVLGPDSSVSPMIFAAIVPLVASDDPGSALALAGMLALIVGLIQIALGAGRLGFVADLLSSDLEGDQWSTPATVSLREAPDLNPAWPRLVADKDRLVAIWSLYQGTTPEEMKSAASVQWSVRDLAPGSAWRQPETLFVRESGDAGGRLIDIAADPRGGIAAIHEMRHFARRSLQDEQLARKRYENLVAVLAQLIASNATRA